MPRILRPTHRCPGCFPASVVLLKLRSFLEMCSSGACVPCSASRAYVCPRHVPASVVLLWPGKLVNDVGSDNECFTASNLPIMHKVVPVTIYAIVHFDPFDSVRYLIVPVSNTVPYCSVQYTVQYHPIPCSTVLYIVPNRV